MEKMNKVAIPNGGEAVMAEYRDQEVMEYQNNPFIEALPPILSKEDAIDKLAYYPPFDENERKLDSHIRLHLVQRLFQYYQPIFQTIDLESRVSRMIRMGYVHRNPFKPEFAQELHENYKSILNANIDMYNSNFKSTTSAMTILGPSGIGKSKMINMILSTLPQLIVHSQYKGTDFNMYQLVWLKLDCSFDGNIKGICIDAFRSMDSKLGTNYYKKFGSARQPIASMQPALALMLKVHGVGLLVIDEVQSLSVAKSGGAEKMMNFFHYLSNMGTPILLIGTPKALPYLRGDLRQARRGSGNQGDMVIERIKKNLNWDLILEGMWDYQWVRKPTPITQEFKDVLYDESGGITDIAIKLFVMAQVRAISSGKEQITPALIRKVAKENLQLIQPMIRALRSGDIKSISRYEDITPIDIDSFINQEYATVSMNEKIKELQKAKKKQEKDWKENMREQAVLKLIELDVEPSKAKKCVDSIMGQQGQELDIKGIVKEAFKLSINIEESGPQPTKKPKKMQNKQDLRLIVSEGKEKGLSAHESLKEKGIIKVIENDFFSVG